MLSIAAPTYGNLPVTQLNKVIDGDTIKVTIDSVHPLLGDRINIRVKDIDTPETRKWKYGYKCQQELELGLEAKRVAEELADILIYLIRLADKLDVDLDQAVADKIVKNGVKYPTPKKHP